MKRILIYSAVAFLSIQISTAQQPEKWTLDRCIAQAMEQNIALKIQHNLEEKTSYTYQQSQWNLLPTINGSGYYELSLKRSTDQDNNISSGRSQYAQYGLSAYLNLFSGFTALNSISAAKFNKLACGESSNLAENQLIINVMTLFAQAQYQKSLVDVLKERLEVSNSELERIKANISVGNMEAVAESEINATVSGNKLKLGQAENEYKLLLLKLSQLIELPSSSDFDIDTEMFDAMEISESYFSTEEIYAQACNSYPAILQKEYELGYYKKELHIAEGSASPSLSLGGSYGTRYYSTDTLASFSEQAEKYLSPSISATLSIPIFNGMSKTMNIKRSRIDMENAMYELESQKKTIKQEIENAIFQSEAFYLEYVNASDNLHFVEISFETYREKYRLGLISTTDFITAQNQLAEAKANVKKARYSWIVQQKTIDLYKGIRNIPE